MVRIHSLTKLGSTLWVLWARAKIKTMGPEDGTLICNPYVPIIYRLPIRAHTFESTSTRKKRVRAQILGPRLGTLAACRGSSTGALHALALATGPGSRGWRPPGTTPGCLGSRAVFLNRPWCKTEQLPFSDHGITRIYRCVYILCIDGTGSTSVDEKQRPCLGAGPAKTSFAWTARCAVVLVEILCS